MKEKFRKGKIFDVLNLFGRSIRRCIRTFVLGITIDIFQQQIVTPTVFENFKDFFGCSVVPVAQQESLLLVFVAIFDDPLKRLVKLDSTKERGGG